MKYLDDPYILVGSCGVRFKLERNADYGTYHNHHRRGYNGYNDYNDYNDYNLSMIEELDDQERRIVTKVLNITMAMMGLGLVLLAIRQILG